MKKPHKLYEKIEGNTQRVLINEKLSKLNEKIRKKTNYLLLL